MGIKWCNICQTDKDVSAFHKKRSARDGLNHCCKQCQKERDQNPERMLARNLSTKKWHSENPEKIFQYSAKSRNNNRTSIRQRSSNWRKSNPHKHNALTAKHRAQKRQATPLWLTPLHLQQIDIFYDAAARLTKEFGRKMHVDHIVPLNGKNICGLHVPWNLQVLFSEENLKKSNSLQGESHDDI